MVRVLILADLGRNNYHVGDEAMGIATAHELSRRDLAIYIATSNPEHSRQHIGGAQGYIQSLDFPGYPADREKYFEEICSVLNGETTDSSIQRFIDEVASMDGILLAGGGNMNSTYGWLLYERAVYGLIAQKYGIPLVISGQSLGPVLTNKDSQTLKELLTHSKLVGVREETSEQWTKDQGVTAYQVVDDATFYVPENRTLSEIELPELPSRYICATFVGISPDQAHDIALALDEMYREYQLVTVFLPHKGNSGEWDEDHHSHREIAQHMTSNPILLPILHTDEAVRIHRRAEVAIANRYHPGVFSLSAGVPFIALIPDAFTDIRVRGMMSHYGAEEYALSLQTSKKPPYSAALHEIIKNREELSAQLLARAAELREFSTRWWDVVEQTMRTGEVSETSIPSLSPALPLSTGDWNLLNLAERDAQALTSLEVAQDQAERDRTLSWERDYQLRRDRLEPLSDTERKQAVQRIDDEPVVSVVIPTFNAAHFIGNQLECLARQVNAPAFEVIVSDNRSTDNLSAVVDTFRERLNIRIVDSSAIQNVSHARNQGILVARTDYILICDADDFVCEDWVRSLYRTLREHPRSYVLGQYLDVPDTGDLSLENPEIYRLFTQPKWQDLIIQEPNPHERIQTQLLVGGASLGIRKEDAIELMGFDSSYVRGGDDWDFWARARIHGMKQIESYGAAVIYRVSTSTRKQFRRHFYYGINDILVKTRFPVQVDRNISLYRELSETVKVPYRLVRYRDHASKVKTFSKLGYALGSLTGSVKYSLLKRVPEPILMEKR